MGIPILMRMGMPIFVKLERGVPMTTEYKIGSHTVRIQDSLREGSPEWKARLRRWEIAVARLELAVEREKQHKKKL